MIELSDGRAVAITHLITVAQGVTARIGFYRDRAAAADGGAEPNETQEIALPVPPQRLADLQSAMLAALIGAGASGDFPSLEGAVALPDAQGLALPDGTYVEVERSCVHGGALTAVLRWHDTPDRIGQDGALSQQTVGVPRSSGWPEEAIAEAEQIVAAVMDSQ